MIFCVVLVYADDLSRWLNASLGFGCCKGVEGLYWVVVVIFSADGVYFRTVSLCVPSNI